MRLTVDGLVAACADDAFESGLLIEAALEPLGGGGSPVKPAVYAGNRYQQDKRWYGDEHLDVVVIDNVPSQANRLEAALEHIANRIGLPRVVVDLTGIEHLPPHLPTSLNGLRFPHRSADAYLRDALLDGEAFTRTPTGKAILTATADAPQALFEWFPQALLFGFWVSHAGRKASQAKLARSWVSEIVGIAPGTTETTVQGLKGDPLNLNTDNSVIYNPDFVDGWQYGEEKKAAGTKKKESLSEIGHGQVPVGDAKAAISFRNINQRATVSFAALRRVQAGSPDANATGRALLVALGLVAHVGAFGRSFSLRSGCELRTALSSWTWLGASADQDRPIEAPSLDEAIELFDGCGAQARAAGLPVGDRWRDARMDLTPNAELVKVIRSSYALES